MVLTWNKDQHEQKGMLQCADVVLGPVSGSSIEHTVLDLDRHMFETEFQPDKQVFVMLKDYNKFP